MERLRSLPHAVGLRQSEKAIRCGAVALAFLAEDTDFYLAEPFLSLCEEAGVPVERVESKKVLGKACRVDVPVACAVILSQNNQ